MRKTTNNVALILLALVSCSFAQSIANITPGPPPYLFEPPVVRFEGGDGSSLSNAVMIKGAVSTTLGIKAERHWIDERYGYGTKLERQSLQEHMGRQANGDAPWMELVSNATATVHWQAETEFNNSVIAVEEMKNGQKHGLAKFWLRSGGAGWIQYSHGKQNGLYYSWHKVWPSASVTASSVSWGIN